MSDPQTAQSASVPQGYVKIEDNGFNDLVGPIYVKRDGDSLSFFFDVKAHHLNDGGVVHGGMSMTFADVVLGTVVHDVVGAPCATISLNCDFVAAAKDGDRVTGTAHITRKSRSVVFVSGDLRVGEKTIMTATGLWKVLGQT